MSLVIALLLALVPLPYQFIYWQPEWLILVILFWVLVDPNPIGLGSAWILGLLLDLLNGT
jgi:rod shape-determining protein MreD